MSTHQNEAKSIFLRAVEISSADERQAYVEAQCKGDEQLYREVNDLLVHHQGLGSFLEAPAAPPAVTTDHQSGERLGTMIGPYKLLQQIGEGGMGVVWMAEQVQPVQRKVALKVIKPGMDSRQVIARFEAERQALAVMDHVNIARVFDGGATESGRPYFVMELVHGVPITKYCDDNHLTPRERLELFVPVCQAIQHAHQKGIIHRDIKPSNVMVTLYDGKPVPKVIDFGVAKATEQRLTERTLFTQAGTMVGTLEYMSPEQAEMSPLGVDTRSDIYALGVLLYELLTGNTPLTHKRMKEAAYAEILRMIKEEEPQKPSTRLSDSGEALASISAQRHMEPAKLTKLVRGELDWIVMKTLEKDRNRRYESASAFAADVQRYLNDDAVQACPPSAWYRVRKLARRNKGAFAAASGVALAVLLAVVGLAVSNVFITREKDLKALALEDKGKALETANESYKEARTQERLAKAQELLARRRFYAAQMNLAMRAWEAGDLARVLDLLESQRPRPDKDDLRTFEWYYLWRLCHSGRRLALRGHSGYVYAVAFSPDGKTLASGSGDGTVKLWDLGTGQARATLKIGSGVTSVAFSPDGEAVTAGSCDGLLRLWDSRTGQLRATFRGHRDIVWALAISADSKTLVSGSQDRTVMLWDVTTGKPQATLEGQGVPVLSVAISPDGKTVASASGWNDVAKVWDVAARRERFALPGATVTFAADGTLATGSWFGIKLWDVTTGKERWQPPALAERSRGTVSASAFTPDGKSLVFASHTRTVWLWDVATGHLRPRLGRQGHVHAVAVSPDGSALAVAATDGPIEVWGLPPAEETICLAHAGGRVTFAFAPDGKTLASGGAGGTKFWDLATGRAVADVAAHPRHAGPSFAGLMAFSPDGAVLAVTDGKTVKLFDAATHQEVGTLFGHEQPVNQVAFSGDGKFLVTLAPDGAKRWDLATRQVSTVIPRCAPLCLAVSPDGRTLATSGQCRTVELWDAVTGQRKAELAVRPGEHYEWTWTVAFAPDGKTLAAGGSHGEIALWDVESGRLRAALKGETGTVAALAFSPDGNTLASGSERTVKLWEIATGQERITLKRQVSALAFSPDGKTLAAGSWQGEVLLWPAATDPAALARLDPSSPGNDTGGEGPGADVDRTGPGPAYEPWKKTPEYQQWLHETGQAKKAEARKAERNAFVLLGGKGAPGRKFDTLVEALLATYDGDTIEIRGNGPFVCDRINIKQALTIRAGEGFQPVINLTVAPKPFHQVGLACYAPLVLEGLEFRVLDPDEMNGKVTHIVVVPLKGLRVANCRFSTDFTCLADWGISPFSVLEFRNCEFLGSNHDSRAVVAGSASGQKVVLENCVSTMPCVVSGGDVKPKAPSVQLTRNTFRTYRRAVEFQDRSDRTRDLDDAKNGNNVLPVEASGNLFDSKHVLVFTQLPPGKILSPADAEMYLAQVVGWKGERNLYSVAGQFLTLWSSEKGHQDLAKPLKTLVDWKQFWTTAEDNSIEGLARYQGGDLLAKVKLSPEKITPEDFRLRPDSAGYRAGKDGKDLGADVNLVGPGPGYERWKKTPEYQQWLKEAKQVTKAEAPKAERGAFVVLRDNGIEVRKYDTLAEAVQGANGGDTIEVRGNGPFASVPIKLGNTALTIRAGAGFRPVITDTPQTMPDRGILLSASGPLRLEGLELRRNSNADILYATGPLFVANCRFLNQTPGSSCIWSTSACLVRNCELLSPRGALTLDGSSDASFVVENCLLVGHNNLNDHDVTRGATVRFTRNSFVTSLGHSAFYHPLYMPRAQVSKPPSARMRVFASENVLDCYSVYCLMEMGDSNRN